MNVTPYQKPGQPGIIAGEPPEVYHSTPALSSTAFRLFCESPRRYQARYLTGEIPPPAPKACFDLGSAFHTAVLEPGAFGERYALYDPPPYAGEGAKKRRADYDEAWRQEHGPNTTQLSAEQLETVTLMAAAARQAVDVEPGDETELTFRADTEFGTLQCRVDLFKSNGQAWDIKSCRDISRFRREYFDFGYDRQEAFYRYVMSAVLGCDVPPLRFLAVESTPPHEVAVFAPAEEDAAMAKLEVFRDLVRYAECVRAGEWPGMYPDPVSITAPPWRRSAMEEAAAAEVKGYHLLAAFEAPNE